MIKLFKDSIFKPKNLIAYRAKSGTFTFFYVLLISLICGLAYMIEPLKYNGITYNEMFKISDELSKDIYRNSKINDGFYEGNPLTITVFDSYGISFIDSKDSLSVNDNVKGSVIICKGNEIYLNPNNSFGQSPTKVLELNDLSELFNDEIDLYKLDSNSQFFKALNDFISKIKPVLVVGFLLAGALNSAITMLLFGLLNYFYLVMFYQAPMFMKKGQLFKMVLFATTSVAMANAFVMLIDMNAILLYLIIFISFIPSFALEKEIIKRIRMKILGEKVINDSKVINKINEILKDNTNKDENGNQVIDVTEEDLEEDDDDDNESED